MNKTLAVGLLITLLMLIVAIFGPALAPYELEDRVKIETFVNEKGEWDAIAPPMPPSAQYPLGTDREGRDMLTKLLYGAKYTLFVALGVAISRVVIGGLIGIILGFYSKAEFGKQKPASYWNLLSGIPIFLIIWFILYVVSLNPPVAPWKLSLLMAVLFFVIGLPSVIFTVKEKTIEIRERPFILASKSVGSGHLRIIGSHLFPHLKESFLVLIVNEVILTLTLLGQLGIFNLFVGGTIATYNPEAYYSRTNEWAGLIGSARYGVYVYPWILFFPLAAYGILILGFYFISKGLESLYKAKYSKFSNI